MIYEYIRIIYDGNLEELNNLASSGWVLKSSCAIKGITGRDQIHFILERVIALENIQKVRNFYGKDK